MAAVAATVPARPGRPLTDAEVARIVWGLRDGEVRDLALGSRWASDPGARAEQLWTECTRRAPAPLDAAPATLLAVSAWLRGDGAMANIALDRALDERARLRPGPAAQRGAGRVHDPGDLRALLTAAGRPPPSAG